MQEQLSGIDNIDYEFIFGKHFERDFVEQIINKNSIYWNRSMFSKQPTYLQQAYSCAEGHRRIMETFLNQTEYEWCLVIEDDCELPKTIAENVNYIIDTFDQDWYHLSTEAFNNYKQNIKPVYTGNPILNVGNPYKVRSTMCYLVNKKFAMKYYKDLCPIATPSDITLCINNQLIPIISNINIYFSDDQKHSLIGSND